MAHSKRAKQNMTRQMKFRLTFLQNTLRERHKTLAKIRTYAKYKLPGYNQTLLRELSGIAKVKKDISNLKVLILRRQKNGEINKIIVWGIII